MTNTQELELLDAVLFWFERDPDFESEGNIERAVRAEAKKLSLYPDDYDVRLISALAYEQLVAQ